MRIEDDKRPDQNKYIKMYQDYREKIGQFTANVQSPDKPNCIFTAGTASTETRNTAFGG